MLNTDLHQYSWGGQFIWIGFQFLDALHPFTVLECSNRTNFQLNDVSSTKKMLIIFSQEPESDMDMETIKGTGICSITLLHFRDVFK